METKLTLRLRKTIIERAKKYSRSNKTSLSKMVESYLESLTEEDPDRMEITPLVSSLSGVIQLEDDFDHNKIYTDHLTEKYS